ncbi:hypothetical protein FXO37_01944 [Capsicum annuum]|nr:hypothetical protein FXO37_01944 [Capsicum annuum]
MLVSLVVQGYGIELVPYAPLLVVSLLSCMSDSDHSVRQSVTHRFATLMPLLPLAYGASPPIGLSEHLSRSQEDVKFLEQLIDNSHIDNYKLSTELKFHASYGKPLLAARDSKCLAKDVEARVLIMEALHKQDRYCDPSPVQLILYEQFSGSHVRQEISNMIRSRVAASDCPSRVPSIPIDPSPIVADISNTSVGPTGAVASSYGPLGDDDEELALYDDFSCTFIDRLFSQELMDAKSEEFMNLKQGKMSCKAALVNSDMHISKLVVYRQQGENEITKSFEVLKLTTSPQTTDETI